MSEDSICQYLKLQRMMLCHWLFNMGNHARQQTNEHYYYIGYGYGYGYGYVADSPCDCPADCPTDIPADSPVGHKN